MKNQNTTQLVAQLKKAAIEHEAPIWKRLASEIEKPMRNKRAVNLWKIEKYCKVGEIVVVPGKVLGTGELTKKVTIVANSYSNEALTKINKVGSAMKITEFMKQNVKGRGARIIG